LLYTLVISNPAEYHTARQFGGISKFKGNHGLRRDFLYQKEAKINSTGLNQSADALCTQHLANFAPIFIHTNSLQVWAKSTGGGFLRPGTITTKSRFLSTMCTLCHNSTSFSNDSGIELPVINNLVGCVRQIAEPSYHRLYPNSSHVVKFTEESYDWGK
jgi:hypothetical protein